MPCKAESWHALSYWQYFLTPCFLDICPWVFKKQVFKLLWYAIYVILEKENWTKKCNKIQKYLIEVFQETQISISLQVACLLEKRKQPVSSHGEILGKHLWKTLFLVNLETEEIFSRTLNFMPRNNLKNCKDGISGESMWWEIFRTIINTYKLRELSVFGVILVRIFPHLDWILRAPRISVYPVLTWKNTDQNNSEYFLCSDKLSIIVAKFSML